MNGCKLIRVSAFVLAATVFTVNSSRATGYTVTGRGADYKVLQKITVEHGTNRVHRYTELATGMNYTNASGQWVESKEQITILPQGGAVAVQGRHKVYFPEDIGSGVLTVITPDGRALRSRPLGVSYDDGSNTVFIATLTNSIGWLTSSNQVTYRNCFVGIKADLVCTYRRGGFECDLVFRQQPPAPADFGLDPEASTLQLVTEFFNTADPEQVPAASDEWYGLQDNTLKFGRMTMGRGIAFALSGTNSNSQLPSSNSQVPVYKRWLHLDNRTFLVEEVPLTDLADDLDALPLTASATPKTPVISSKTLFASGRGFPPAHEFVADTNQIQIAAIDLNRQPGVVLDYNEIDDGYYNNFTFFEGNTYYIPDWVSLSGTTIVQGGAVIKYGANGGILLDSSDPTLVIVCETTPNNVAVFTAVDDDSAGETIDGSTGNPSGYYGGQNLIPASEHTILHDVRFCHLNQTINISSYGYANLEIDNAQFIDCCSVAGSSYFTCTLKNVLVQGGSNVVSSSGGMLQMENVTLHQVQAIFADGDGSTAYLTNCLVVAVTDTNTGSLFGQNNAFLDSDAGVFQTWGDNHHYLPPDSPYIDAGNATAAQVGLCHYTTQASQVEEGLSTVDLGYHYVPADDDGNPPSDFWDSYIMTQPVNQTVAPGGTAVFAVSAGAAAPCDGPFAYQWQHDGTNIWGAFITTAAGNGISGYSGDHDMATDASLAYPYSVAVDAAGNLYVADAYNGVIRRVDTNGIITTVAGNYSLGYGYSGDGDVATNASLSCPYAVAVDVSGNLYIADTGNAVIRKVDTNGIITTAAGNYSLGDAYWGDGDAATNAALDHPYGAAVDGAGNLYIADTGNDVIRKVDTNGIITTVVGTATEGGYSGDGGAATDATLHYPSGIALDASGSLFIADTDNSVIRKVNTNGIITTVAGNWNFDYSGDGGIATAASLNQPYGVAVDASGNLYIADTGNNVIREVGINGFITTLAGNVDLGGGYSGDGGAATDAGLNQPCGVAVNVSGNLLYIADSGNNVIRDLGMHMETHSLSNVTTNDAGTYQVIVSSPCGSVTSSVVTLTVNVVDSDGDGLPDWWELYWFGDLSHTGSELDGSGHTLLYDYQNGFDPPDAPFQFFSIQVANNYVNASAAPVQLEISGRPYYIAVSVDDPDYFTNAVWTAFTSTNVTVNLGLTEGWHDVWIGLRGHADDTNAAVWQWKRLKLDLTSPGIVVTSPVMAGGAATVDTPMIQLMGYSPEALDSISYDLSNAAGTVTNQQVLVLNQFYDTNTCEFTTNTFQAFDLDLTNGVNIITLHATDMAGNVTTTNFSILLDYSTKTNPPEVEITWPANGTEISGSRFTVDGQVADPTVTMAATITDTNGDSSTINGLVERTGKFWVERLPLNSGTNTVSLTVTDAAGNVSVTNFTVVQSAVTLTVDPVPDASQLWQPTVNLTGKISDATYAVWVNGVKGSVSSTANSGGLFPWSASHVPVNSGGTASFTVIGYAPNEQQPDGTYGNP